MIAIIRLVNRSSPHIVIILSVENFSSTCLASFKYTIEYYNYSHYAKHDIPET